MWKTMIALALVPLSLAAASTPLGTGVPRDEKEDVENALLKLAAAENLSWVETTIEEKEGRLPKVAEAIEGQSARNGWCRLFKPGDKQSFEAFLKFDRIAMRTSDGWNIIDVTEAAPGEPKPEKIVRQAQRFLRARSPVAEAKILLGRVQEMHRHENGLYSARLAEKDVELILESAAAAGMKIPTFEEPKLRVNFRITEGVLESFELVVAGKELKKNGTVEDNLISVAVDFSDVGTTALDIPDEVRRLLE